MNSENFHKMCTPGNSGKREKRQPDLSTQQQGWEGDVTTGLQTPERWGMVPRTTRVLKNACGTVAGSPAVRAVWCKAHTGRGGGVAAVGEGLVRVGKDAC